MKVFVAGPRAVNSLSPIVVKRLSGLAEIGMFVLVGDANGVDCLVQQCFVDLKYRNVIVYASNGRPRNNVGNWEVRNVSVREKTNGFDFYTQKDIQMAEDADYGFMIWNGESKGTLNNMINLVMLNKCILVYFIPDKAFYTLRDTEGLYILVNKCGVRTSKLFSNLLSNKHSPRHEQITLEIN